MRGIVSSSGRALDLSRGYWFESDAISFWFVQYIRKVWKKMKKLYFKRHASTILTCMGGVGVIVTSVIAVKSTPKALYLLEEAEKQKGSQLTKLETIKVAGPVYIPAVVSGAASIACIFGANILNKRQQAALMSSYAFLDNSYKEYRKKVDELYGEGTDIQVKEEIAKDHYQDIDIQTNEIEQLFYDAYSNQYFKSTKEKVLEAEYEINKTIAVNGGAYLYEFYELLGIPYGKHLKELGWSQGILSAMYWTYWLDFYHRDITTEDGLDCCMIVMEQEPVVDFEYY